MRHPSLVVGLLLGLLTAPTSAAEQNPAGRWSGQWEREGSILDVEVTFVRTASGYEGSFSSAHLRVVGIPFQRVRYEEPKLSWDLVGDATTSVFDGVVQADTIAGRFREGDAVGTFRLTREPGEAAPVREEEIRFGDAQVTLRGTVVYPAGPGPFPGVVFLHGSGAEGRWASRYLADAFARRGIAALIYDKRGVGASTGDWRDAGFAELVKDAAAAVEALRSRPRIAPDRVGIHGHSQGATIAPWVANENASVAFVVASAATGLSMAETETYSVGNAVGLRRMGEAERRLAQQYIHTLVATAYGGAPRAEVEAAYQGVRDRPWAFAPPPATDSYWSFSRRIAAYDPLEHWRRVSAPVLLVYGEADERVPPRPSAERIAQAYLASLGSRLEVLLFPGGDHTFRLPPSTPGRFEWPKTVPGYPDRVIDWIQRVSRP